MDPNHNTHESEQQAPNHNENEHANKKTPADFLNSVIGQNVVVKLNSGVNYRGIIPFEYSSILYGNLFFYSHLDSIGNLACLDGYMNIAMEQTEEYVDGELKNRYGDAFIRGNNGKHSCD